MIKCVCNHKKTDHSRYQYKGGPSEYGQCTKCYAAYERLPYREKVKAVQVYQSKGNMFGIPIGCNEFNEKVS